ncbi:hypothetical protein QTQ03_28925, partial [Micromonospora sp. WMMA1363]
MPTDEAIDRLVGHEAFRPDVTPIQLFNKATDPFLPGVKPHLFQVLRAMDASGFTNHVLLITRFKVTEADMAALEKLRHLRVTLLFTYSGISDPRVEPISKSEITVTSIRTAAAHKRRTGWCCTGGRSCPAGTTPPTPWRTCSTSPRCRRDRVHRLLPQARERRLPARTRRARAVRGGLPPAQDHARRPRRRRGRRLACLRISTPLFRKTSCGVAYAHEVADYNGHWGVRELCDICPAAQQRRCADDHTQPTPASMDRILGQLGYQTQYVIEDGHVWTHGLGEQRRYAIQHGLRYQIWNSTSPTTCTPTADPSPDTAPTPRRSRRSRRCAGSSSRRRGMKM